MFKVEVRKLIHFINASKFGFKAFARINLVLPFRPIKGDELKLYTEDGRLITFFEVDKISWDAKDKKFTLENAEYNSQNGIEGAMHEDVKNFFRYNEITAKEIIEEAHWISTEGWELEIFSSNPPDELKEYCTQQSDE